MVRAGIRARNCNGSLLMDFQETACFTLPNLAPPQIAIRPFVYFTVVLAVLDTAPVRACISPPRNYTSIILCGPCRKECGFPFRGYVHCTKFE